MNERINELIKQSYVTVRSQNDRDVTYFSQEKFAELIVRECAEVLDTWNKENGAQEGLDKEGLISLWSSHFGVEE